MADEWKKGKQSRRFFWGEGEVGGREGSSRERGGSKRQGMGDVSPCPTLQGNCFSCLLCEMLQRGAVCLTHSELGHSSHVWDCSKTRGGNAGGKGDGGRNKGFCHPCSLQPALTALFNSREIEVRCLKASFYLAQVYSNLPWAQKHSFSICQKVVLLTLKCQTVTGSWIQNWLLQRSDNTQFYSDFFFKKSFWTTTTKKVYTSPKPLLWNKSMQPGAQSFLRKGDADQDWCGPWAQHAGRLSAHYQRAHAHRNTHTHTHLGLVGCFNWIPVHLHHELTPCMLAQPHCPLRNPLALQFVLQDPL